MKWSRREALKIGGAAALSGVALEAMSLLGWFDNRQLAHVDPSRASTIAERLFTLDGLEHGGLVHLGQSTHLIQLGGLRVLTDPWFYDPAFGSLRHPEPLMIAPQALPELDVIVITHDHPDHADRRALDRLDKNALVIVGVASLLPVLRGMGFARVEHVPADQSVQLGSLNVNGVAALHDVPETGYALSSGEQSIYFAGDTATHPQLAAIGERWDLSLAILPIDGTKLRWESRLVMDPNDAANAAMLLNAKQVMSSHADALYADPIAQHLLSEQAPNPQQTFKRLMQVRAPDMKCTTPKPGDLIALT